MIFGIRNQWIEEPSVNLTLIEINLHSCQFESAIEITIMGIGIMIGFAHNL